MDVVTGFSVCLRANRSRCIGTVVERETILGIGSHHLVEAEPELVVPCVGLLGCGIHHNTARAVETNTVGDDRRLRSTLVNLGEEAADVVAFHVAVVNQVNPANLLGLANRLNFHALDDHIGPVGTLDGMQVAETLVLGHLLQVDSIGITLLEEVLL